MYTSNYCQQGRLGIGNLPFSFVILILLSLFFFSSCKVIQAPSLLKYTSRDTTIKDFVNSDFEVKIQKNDILSINVSSLNIEEDDVFNAPIKNSSGDSKLTGPGYLVSLDGNIFLHKLGVFHVAGLTRKQLKLKLEKELQPYFKDPIVTINFANHRITLVGQISNPQVLNIPAEKISIFDALAISGSITDNARLDDVTVIRETEGVKEFKHLNLTDYSIFSSPWYFLQPNDILLIHPDQVALNGEKKQLRNQQVFTIAFQVITLTVIVIQNFFRK